MLIWRGLLKRPSRPPGRGGAYDQTGTGSSPSWFASPLPDFSALWRAAGTGLLLVVLVLGSLDLHRAGALHGDSFGAPEWSPRTTTLTHGGRLHVCRADVVVQQPCPGCIHRLQTSGAHLLRAVRPAILDEQSFVPPGVPLPAGRLAFGRRPARGPPVC
jgi:hypothetical protein